MRRKTLTGVFAVGFASLLLGLPAPATAGPASAGAAAATSLVPRAQTAKVVPLRADEQISRSVVASDGRAQTTRETSQLYRDSLGRTRLEAGSVVTINDPIARSTVQLDLRNRVYVRSVTPPASTGATTLSPSVAAGPVTGKTQQLSSPPRDLGTATIAGVRAQGRQYTVTIPTATAKPITKDVTLWLSNDVQLAVRTVIVDQNNQTYEKSYANIQAGVEPAASLFGIPAGFREASAVANPLAAPDCPLSTSPDPLLLSSFGFSLGLGTITGVTDFPNAGCLIAASAIYVEYPLAFRLLDPAGLPYLRWLVGDTGGLLPYVPYVAFGDAAFLAVNTGDTTTKDSLIVLTVFY